MVHGWALRWHPVPLYHANDTSGYSGWSHGARALWRSTALRHEGTSFWTGPPSRPRRGPRSSIVSNILRQCDGFISTQMFSDWIKIALHCEELSKFMGSGKSSHWFFPSLFDFIYKPIYLLGFYTRWKVNLYCDRLLKIRSSGTWRQRYFFGHFWNFLQTHTPFCTFHSLVILSAMINAA